MRPLILSSVACPVLQYFSTLSHKRYGFRGKKKILNTKEIHVLIFSANLSEIFFHSEKNSGIYYHKCGA